MGYGVETLVRPGDTGVIVGSGIYTGTNVLVYKNSVSESNLLSELPTSGYSTDGSNSTVKFTYPNAFDSEPTDFYVSLKNERDDSINYKTFKAFRRPIISGFTPLSGSYGDIITVTGFFGTPASTWSSSNVVGPIVPSGVSIGDHIVPEASQFGGSNVPVAMLSQNTLLVEIPKNSSSNIITVTTSGGTASSSQILTVFPPQTLYQWILSRLRGKTILGRNKQYGFCRGSGFWERQPYNDNGRKDEFGYWCFVFWGK